MMIDTVSIPDSETSILAHGVSVAPDQYLDARRPAWVAHERAGRVHYARRAGERRARLYIDPAANEILDVVLPARPVAPHAPDGASAAAVRAEERAPGSAP
jgi:hypothetical protein